MELLGGDQLENPFRKATAPFDFAVQSRVVELAMRVDQTRREHPLTEIAHVTRMRGTDLRGLTDSYNRIAVNRHRAIFNRRLIHRQHVTRSQNHHNLTRFYRMEYGFVQWRRRDRSFHP